VHVAGEASAPFGKSLTQTVSKNVRESNGDDRSMLVGRKFRRDAHDEIVLRCAASQIIMKKNGDILIDGTSMTVKAAGKVVAKGSKIGMNQ
jgi:type VI secretion system secreted protein VgrG